MTDEYIQVVTHVKLCKRETVVFAKFPKTMEVGAIFEKITEERKNVIKILINN